MGRKKSRKKNKSNVGWFILGVFVLAVVGAFAIKIGLGAFIQQTFFSQGVSVLSVDAPNVVSENQDLSSLNWLVLTSLSGGDRIRFALSQSDFEVESGVASEKPFVASAENIEEVLTYKINLQSDPVIWDVDITSVLDDKIACPEGWLHDYVLSGFLVDDRHFCILSKFDGRYGKLSNPTKKFKADLVVSNGDEELRQTISSDVGSVEFRDKSGEIVATASWVGSLVTGNPDPEVPDFAVIGPISGEKWKFVRSGDFNEYINAQEDFFSYARNLVDLRVVESSPFNARYEDLYGRVNDLNSVKGRTIERFESLSSGFRLVNPSSVDAALLEFNSEVSLTNPLVTWWIRADWIGVERLVGDPEILSVASSKFGSGDDGFVDVEVRNNGGDASFILNLDGCSDFKQSLTGNSFFLKKGEVDTIRLFVDAGSVNKDLSETCSVVVRDKNLASVSVSDSVTLLFEATRVCTPGLVSVDESENALYRCDEDGLGRSLVVDCEDGFIASYTGKGKYDGYECVEEEVIVNQEKVEVPVGNVGSVVDDSGGVSVLRIVLSSIVALIAGIFYWVFTKVLSKSKGLMALRVVGLLVVVVGVFFGVGWLFREIASFFNNIFGVFG